MTLQEWIDAGAPGLSYWFDAPEGCPVGGTFKDEDGALVARVRAFDLPFPCGAECCGYEYPQYTYVPEGVEVPSPPWAEEALAAGWLPPGWTRY